MTGLRLTPRGEAALAALLAAVVVALAAVGLALPVVLPWTGVRAASLVGGRW